MSTTPKMAPPMSFSETADAVYGGLGPTVMAVTWTCFSIATVTVALRHYVKWGMKRPGTWSLAWITASWFFGVLSQIGLTLAVRAFGIGNHIDILIKYDTTGPAVLWVWIAQFFALLCIGLGKVAASAFLLSIQGDTASRASRIFLIGIALLNVLIDGSVMIALWFQCDPTAKLWDTTIPGNCSGKVPVEIIGITAGSINAVSDVLLALYPGVMLWKIQMDGRIKLGLCGLMGLGVFAGVCSAIKTSEVTEIPNTIDPTYNIGKLVVWALCEEWIVIIVTSIPPLWPLVNAFLRRAQSSGYGRSRSKHSQLPGHELGGTGPSARPSPFASKRGPTETTIEHGTDHSDQTSISSKAILPLQSNAPKGRSSTASGDHPPEAYSSV